MDLNLLNFMDNSIGKSLKAFNQVHYKNNKLQQIRGFCNVVTFKSVTEAAKIMGLSQPAISTQIKSLERDLGKILFKKNKKFLTPTEEGLAFYEFVMPTLKKLDGLYEEYLVHTDEKENNTLRIAGYHSALTRFAPKIISVLSKSHPFIKYQVTNCTQIQAIEGLRKGVFDIIFFNIQTVPEDLIAIKTLYWNPTIVVSRQNPLSSLKRPLEIKDLEDQNFLLIENFKLTNSYLESFKKYNIRTSIDFINLDWEAIMFYVAENIGICFFGDVGNSYDIKLNLKGIDVSHLFPKIEYKFIVKDTTFKSTLEIFIQTANEIFKKNIANL